MSLELDLDSGETAWEETTLLALQVECLKLGVFFYNVK